MAYTVHQAKTHLSRLLKEAEAGKEVVLMRGKKPVARIVAIEEPKKEDVPFRLIGAFPHLSWSPDAFDPLSDEELTEMGLDHLAEAPLVPVSQERSQKK
jgi:antitoxin (DNA-binding transcriptional repressor) of toxin-antitoxin stability system